MEWRLAASQQDVVTYGIAVTGNEGEALHRTWDEQRRGRAETRMSSHRRTEDESVGGMRWRVAQWPSL